MLQALRKAYPNCQMYRYRGYIIVVEKNLDTQRAEYHIYGITANKGFVITMPRMKDATSFINCL